MNKFLITLTSILLSSCAYFINNFDEDVLQSNQIKPQSAIEKVYCPQPRPGLILMSDNQKLQESFIDFSKKIRSFGFIEKAVLWSLLQMNARPDLSSISSRIQIIIKKDNKESYINSYAKDANDFPFLFGLESLLKKFESKYTLLQLAKILDSKFSSAIYVSKDFAQFLKDNHIALEKHNELKSYYIRGDEPLRFGEKIKKINFSQIILKYQQVKLLKNYKTSSFLFKNKKVSSMEYSCNFDMSIYQESVFLIANKKIRTNTFGFKDGEDVFMATSSQKIKKIESIPSTLFFKGSSEARGASLCRFKNSLSSLWLISSDSRDPGQHLFHLTEYGLQNTTSTDQLDQLLKFSRHQFLKDPVRLIIESKRSSKEQLTKLLKLNLPIYNSKSLGKVWGYFDGPKSSSFALDDRHDGHLTCMEK